MNLNNKRKTSLIIGGLLFGLLSGCTSFNNYKYAVEGQPDIATPTKFPSTDQEDIDYQNQVVVSDSKFYNSYWFENNKSNLDTQSSDFKLVSLYNINYLKSHTDSIIQINGYASELGSNNKNLNLSISRANFIKNYYISQGVSKEQIKVKGYGNSILVYPEGTQKNNPSNRRVDIIYIQDQPKDFLIDNQKPIINIIKSKVELVQQNQND